jgi:hypothetical protein
MPYYRLKSGKLINVPENLLEDFKSSEQFEGAVLIEEEVKPVKTEAVATEDASVTAMDSASENGSLEPLSNKQASFNYEQRTGNKPGSIMDLTDDDYIEKGPMGETLRKKNSSGVVITDYEEIKKTLEKTPEAKQKLIKLATNYAEDGLEGDVFDTWEDARQYIDDQSDKFDEEAKAEKEQIYKFDDNFKLKDKAIEQLRKDTGNTSNTFDTPFSQGLFKQGLQSISGNWINDAKTDVPSQVIELEESLEGAIAGGEDVRTLQKLAYGKMNLQDKEALINKYRIPKILEVRKELVKEYDALKLETEDVFGDLKRQESSLVRSMNLIKNNKPATGYTQETVDKYNGLFEQYNSLKDTFKQTSDRYKGKQESLDKSQEVINAQWGVDIARMALKSNFKLTDDVKKYTEAFSGDGVFNWAVDQVGGTAQEMVKLAGQTVVGFPVFVTTAFGDLFTDDDTYSSFDSMRDTWGDLLNFNVVPDSKDEKFNITDGEGNLKEFSARAWSKTAFNMIPFTAEIIRNVKQGKFTGYREGLGKMLSNYTKAGAVTKSAQNMKNLIISSDAAFRMTILNNSIEANKKGLSGPAGDLYATTVSFTEGLVQAIMPDYKFIKGGAGKEIKNALFNSLKGLTTKESTKAAVKTYTGNMFKELLEEEVTFGMNIITDMAFGLGALKQNEFVDEQINLIAGTFMLSGGIGLTGAKNTYNAQKSQIYKGIFNNLKSTDLYFKTMLETATDPSLIEDINKARVFVRDVASVMNTAPEDVSSDQIELLIQKKKLIDKKKNTDSSFHGPINDRIKEIDSEIENSSIKRSITERFDKDVSNFAKSLNSIGQKVDETKIFEDDQDGSADDKLEKFLISVGESKEYAKESKDSYGTFVVTVDGKEILVVNKASALSDRVVTTGQHEFLHKFLKASLSSKPELVQQAGELLLKEILASSSSSSRIVARIENYATDDKITIDKFFEEILPLFSEAVTNKEVKLNESSITKIQDFFRRIFQDLGLKNIRFDKAEGVINFIKDYNKAYSKGSFKGSLKALAGKDGDSNVSGVSLSKSVSELNTELEDLIDREFEMDEGDFDAQKSNLELKIRQAKKPSVKKQSSTKEKSAPKKVYDNEGLIETIKSKDPKITGKEKALAKADLVDSFDALALKAIKYDTRKGDYDRNEIKDYLREFFPRVVESFDPSKSKFSTWVTNNMAPKAQQTYEKFKKIADKSLDVEAGGVGSVKEMSGDVNTLYGSDSKPSDLKDSTQKMIKATSFGPISDPSILEAVEDVIDIKEGERPNFKSLNNKFFDKVSEAIFGISGKKARGNATLKYDKSGGSSEANSLQNVFKNDSDVRKFIKTMPDYNIATKETVVNEQGETIDVSRDTYGRSIGINPKVLAIFYDKVDGAIPGISSPNGRSLGKTTQTDVYKLKSEFTGNISPSSVAKLQSLIGINKGTLSIPIKGEARTEFGSILTGLTKMYIDNVINTVGRSKLDNNQAKADLGAGKSSLMFSKNIKEVIKEQEIINNLGLQPGTNHNSLLEIQFSKKARAEYENVLKKKRPELKDIPKQVENLFEWANNLNIPENKKPKYKKLALYYTANGYTIFPEDGYKIEEVIRLSDKNKIDPYAYANPDELINRFTEEVRTEKINPDNVPQLSNKQEMDDGVVIYDVVDSKIGQKAVRSIVDSFWGENANPWCLIARTKERTVDSFPTESGAKKLAEQEASWFIAYKPNMKRWFVMEPVDPKDAMTSAWTHWQQYNVDGLGEGYKIAFQNGKLLSFRDGGEGDPSMTDLGVYDYEIDPQWWDRFDSPTSDLTINLGKDKATGYKIIGSINSKGVIDITGYGEGDFMGRKSDFSLYDADKNLINKKVYKDGKISSSTVVENTRMNDGGRAIVEKKSRYNDGIFSSSVSTIKDLQTGNIVTKSTNSHTYLNENYYIEEFIVVGKNGKTPTAPKVTEKNIVLISIQPNPTRDLSTEYYAERITDGVSDVVIDKMAELEDIKKSYIQLSKSVDKAAKSNNDMLPESQRLTGDFTNQDVLDRMGELDNEINEAELQFSKKADPKLNKEFNDIIENKTGIASNETIAGVKASLMGKKKGRFNFFIPPSAEDFMGLLYATLGKGTLGDSQMKWYKDNLLNPYARGIENITRDRNNLGRDFKALKRDLKIVPRNLKKTVKGSLFTREQAVRVYIWEQIGEKIPDLSKADIAELVALVDSDPKLKLFALEIIKLNKGRAYVSPKEGWNTGTITTDLLEALNTTGRKEYLELWQQNVDTIFSDENLKKLEAAFGESYKLAMVDILKRMKSGRNRGFGNKQVERFTDWINGSTAAIMFFNTRSAALQLISAVNFIDFGDNNVIAAGKAFANQPQYWSDFKTLWNSDFLVERRDGLKININEQDIADVAKESGVRGVINKLLKLGFTPTQLADSFAIASGGSTFYRNRLNSLVKEGMNPIAANKQAMRDFREIAEESQQSSRPDKISQQQAGPLGRIILAFANTPAQYARIIKKAASDIKNGRGDKKTNLSKILYYGVAQNILFGTMQQALFALMFEDEEESESILEEKVPKVINGMVDSISRGTGVYGAIFTVVKNTSIKLYEESQKKSSNYTDKILEVLRISPPIASKLQKARSAARTADWNMDEIKSKGFSLDNPVFLAGGNVVSATTNIPLDRVVKKLNNLKAASDSEVAIYKRIALLMGWNEWELGLTEKKSKTKSKSKAKKTGIKRPTVNSQGKISGY